MVSRLFGKEARTCVLLSPVRVEAISCLCCTPNNAAICPPRCHHIASMGPIISTIILFEAAKSIICIGRRHLRPKLISTCDQLFNFNGYTHLISLIMASKISTSWWIADPYPRSRYLRSSNWMLSICLELRRKGGSMRESDPWIMVRYGLRLFYDVYLRYVWTSLVHWLVQVKGGYERLAIDKIWHI
jgi:hypothetical protein